MEEDERWKFEICERIRKCRYPQSRKIQIGIQMPTAFGDSVQCMSEHLL